MQKFDNYLKIIYKTDLFQNGKIKSKNNLLFTERSPTFT